MNVPRNDWSGREKRTSDRRKISGARVACSDANLGGTNIPLDAAPHLVDIAVGGACIFSTRRLPPGARLTVEITLGRRRTSIKGECEVRWAEQVDRKGEKFYLAGLRFTSPPVCSGGILEDILGLEDGPGAFPEFPEWRSQDIKPIDQRLVRRIPLELDKVVCVPSGLFSSLGLARNRAQRLINLSRKGARVAMAKPMEYGQKVNLRVRIPAIGQILEAEGQVVWTKESQTSDGREEHLAGVAFLPLSVKSKQVLFALERWYQDVSKK